MASFFIDLFGCASDPKAGAKEQNAIVQGKAISPEDEASGLRGFGALKSKMEIRGESAGSAAAVAAFTRNYDAVIAGDTGIMEEQSIDAVEEIPDLLNIKAQNKVDASGLSKILSETAVLKLNGGLGTGMGLDKAKSLLEVKDGMTFLDLIAKQILHTRKKFNAKVRFILMNSFSTSADTMKYLKENYPDLSKEKGIELMQNMAPKVDAKTLGPVYWPNNRDMEWCPPGHGDLYPSLLGTGMLDKLLEDGIKYLFVSNSDNLGATLDLDILNYFAFSDEGFMMEVASRTQADKKGGHLALRKLDKKFVLRESAMVADKDVESFQDISKHKYFNTNNLWIKLDALKATLKANDGVVPLPLIKNKKTVDPKNKKSTPVFQLETAMGSAITSFEKAGAILVPRSRFAPVKTCTDLFALRSDAYRISRDYRIALASQYAPIVKLSDDYKLVEKLDKLVPSVPSLIGCVSIEISGPISIRPNTLFQGRCKLINTGSKAQMIPGGEYVDFEKEW